VNPNSMATNPAEAFGMSCGTMYGLTRSGPLARNTSCCLSRLSSPPMPVENTMPVRVGSVVAATAATLKVSRKPARWPERANSGH
jgi:hypothetical protein